jgi:hypothetical protein
MPEARLDVEFESDTGEVELLSFAAWELNAIT